MVITVIITLIFSYKLKRLCAVHCILLVFLKFIKNTCFLSSVGVFIVVLIISDFLSSFDLIIVYSIGMPKKNKYLII